MKMIVNGHEFDNPTRLDIEFIVDKAGETMERIVLVVHNGPLTVNHGEGELTEALNLIGENGGQLILIGHGAVVG
jgi:hypothetical protein